MTKPTRRLFLRNSAVAGACLMGFASGIFPRAARAAWPKGAFDAREPSEALKNLFGDAAIQASDAIRVKAPEIAENGTVVPITIICTLPNVESISVVAEGNPRPLAASYKLGSGTQPQVSTRIKLAKTQLITGVVKSDGKFYKASKEVKVTIGGCGG